MNKKITARLLPAINKISAERWNALTQEQVCLSHEFLSALEESHCVAPRTGWQPCHLILEEEDKLRAAMPLYLKAHSQGEYIFDHGWADALERAGQSYYPKLCSCVPFTPVGGSRLLGDKKYYAPLLNAARQAMATTEASSLHINFLAEDQWRACTQDCPPTRTQDYMMMSRTHYQFHWHNKGYSSFDDFLGEMTSRRRKNIRKERKRAQENLEIKHFTGSALTETLWDYFFEFYMDTGSRKWGRPYLTRDAFSLLSERLADRILLIMAFRADKPIAAALNFIDKTKLYGRYWGCTEYQDCLHFELSYYQAIDYAIAHQLQVVEAGAQGEHKIERGYIPVKTYSAHAIAHEGLARAVGDYLQHEKQATSAEIAYLNNATPFRKKPL